MLNSLWYSGYKDNDLWFGDNHLGYKYNNSSFKYTNLGIKYSNWGFRGNLEIWIEALDGSRENKYCDTI